MKIAIAKAFLTGVALIVVSASPKAQEYNYSSALPFDGLYGGGYVGGTFNPGASLNAGAMVGTDFAVTDSMRAGLEVQGGLTTGDLGGIDALMLGRAGALLNPDTLVYGAAGGGWVAGSGSYALGGGAEMLVTELGGCKGRAARHGQLGEWTFKSQGDSRRRGPYELNEDDLRQPWPRYAGPFLFLVGE